MENQVTSWAEIDAARKRLGLSRAAFVRRAGISESTIYRGIAAGHKPTRSRLNWCRIVLEARRIEIEENENAKRA